MGLSAHDIHQLMSQADSSSLTSAHRAAHNVTMRYRDLEGRLRSLSEKIAAGWQGNAAQAAQAGATPLTNMLTAAQGAVGTCRESLTQQGFAVDNVRSSVQPVAAEPPHNNVINALTPWHTDL